MFILDLLFGAWRAPKPARSRVYRMIGGANKNNAPTIVAKARILSVLTDEWKTNKQISAETGLQLNTVQQKTAKLFKAGKVERTMQKNQSDIKPICLYKAKEPQ